MRNNSNSVKAFSVLEAVFSMVITAIIIGVVFIIFTMLSERMLDFKNQNEFVADMNRLTYIINKDIFENEKMIADETEITFVSYAGDVTKYKRYDEYTVRSKNEFLDTFKIPLSNIKSDTLKNKNQKIVFQRLNLNFDINKQKMDLRFYKKVYSNQLIESLK